MACLSERSLNDAAARSARAGASRRALALASGDREAELGTLRKQLMRAKAKVRRATDGALFTSSQVYTDLEYSPPSSITHNSFSLMRFVKIVFDVVGSPSQSVAPNHDVLF